MGINHPKLILRKNQNDYSSLAFALKKFLNIDLYHFKNLEKSRCNNCKSIKKIFIYLNVFLILILLKIFQMIYQKNFTLGQLESALTVD